MFPVSRSGIEGYFRTLAEAVPCPVVLYTNPGLLGGDVTPDMIDTLSHVSNISYVKDASSNTGRILTILNRVGDRMKVFSASAHIPMVVLQLGGVGWMAGPACVLPGECVELYNLVRQGRTDEALALQKRLWRANELFQKYSLAACIKAGLQVQGFDVGGPIPPQEPLKAAEVEEIRTALVQLERSAAGVA
jgi:4-hydroxy-tetrahydrodipicolinate synthase